MAALYPVSVEVTDQVAFMPECFLTVRTGPGLISGGRGDIAGVVVQSPVSGQQAFLSEGPAAPRHRAVEGFEASVDQIVAVQAFPV